MFKRGCNGCGEFWYIGNDSTCKCADETPKREWVGLTDEEIEGIAKRLVDDKTYCSLHFAVAIQSKLKERNT
jgi:hypothetical protein